MAKIRFSGKRNMYTSDDIRRKRKHRLDGKTTLVDGVPYGAYAQSIGDLIGAGHMKVHGSLTFEKQRLTQFVNIITPVSQSATPILNAATVTAPTATPNLNVNTVSSPAAASAPLTTDAIMTEYTIKVRSYQHADGRGPAPQFDGYLQSGHPKDPYFRIKGWINDDGTIRIELVKNFDKK